MTSRKAVAYFDSHAEYYASNQYHTGRLTFVNGRHERIISLLAGLQLPETIAALDAGCGPGNLVPEFGRRCRIVFAMDASRNMLQIARSNGHAFGNVRYQAGNIEALPYADGAFDVVCSAGVIEYLKCPDQAMREMHRVLRPGGLLILPTTNIAAPAHWFRPVIQPVARIPFVARAFGIKPGNYDLWYHFVPAFKRRLRALGFELEQERHFYLTLPRPLDRIFPRLALRLERFFDGYMQTPLRHLAEGYIAVATKTRTNE